MKKIYLLLAIGLCHLWYSQNTSFHDTQGNIEVNGGGQLQYTLPIALPPGIKSVAPQVNLTYTSGGGNGIAGYGWNLSGITSISRTGKTIEKDGELQGIKLDYSDYYSFNGQRLILKSGEYGKDGAEYVTEKFSNIKIKSVGKAIGFEGPIYWEVTFEDGSQAWYGNNLFARTYTDYNITKWKDSQGNYITYNYTQSNNVAVISSITWGGNETLSKPHFNEITFEYNANTTRKLPEVSYVRGEKFVQNNLLNNIIVSTNLDSSKKQFKKYKITYKPATDNYQFVNDITEYNSNNEVESANPAYFEYNINQSVPDGVEYPYNPTNFNTKKYGDFNYDGITDYIEYLSNGTINYRSSVYQNTPTIPLSYDVSKFTSADFSKAKIITFKKNQIVKNKAGLIVPHKINTGTSGKFDYEFQIYSIDTNSNQLIYEYSKTIPFAKYDLFTPEGSPGCVVTYTSLGAIEAYDYNGDGVSELILSFSGKERCIVYNPPTVISTPNTNLETENLLHLPLGEDNTEQSITPEPENTNLNPPEGGEYHWAYYSSLVLFDLEENKSVDDSYSQFKYSNDDLETKFTFADFNGDGLADIIELDNGRFSNAYNIKKTTGSTIKVNVENFATQSYSGLFNDALYGDFNGDGKTDILVPQADKNSNWNLYISNGKIFNQSTINNFIYFSAGQEISDEGTHNNFPESGCDYGTVKYYQYNVGDLDADGKSEIIVTGVTIRNHEWNAHHDQEYTLVNTKVYSTTKIDSTTGNAFTDTSGDIKFFNTKSWPTKQFTDKVIPFSTLTLNHTNKQIILVGRPDDCGISNCDYNYVLQYNYQYFPELTRLKKITQGGIITDVEFKELDPVVNPGLYATVKQENFPYLEVEKLNKTYAVSKLRQGLRQQDFRYRGMMTHLQGKGMIGFRQTARSSWYISGVETNKIWSGAEIDPLNEGLPIKEWSIKTNNETQIFPTDLSINNSQLLSFKQTTYQTDVLANGIKAIVPKQSTTKDFLKDVTTVNTITYGSYYLPSQTVSNVNSGFAISTTDIEYIHQPSGIGKDYFIGRPYFKSESISAYDDIKTSLEEYSYSNNLLQYLTKYAYNEIDWIQEKYTYDEGSPTGFGNITKREITNSSDIQVITTKSQYEPKGRFVEKTTDNLGLETLITYNDWGQVKTQTDPLNNTVSNIYDNWGKLQSSTSNLEGITSYQYEKFNESGISGTKITQISPGGNIKVGFTNSLGQNYKNVTKAFEQNKYVVSETVYDLLGRKWFESEPYFANSISSNASLADASTWTEIQYNDNFFPPKVTVKTFNNGKEMVTSTNGRITTITESNGYVRTYTKTTDAIGNLISSSDPGGTITYTYNAAGQQIKAQYAENSVATSYDAWGRKSEFNDPANGKYEYQYTGFGEIKKETSRKGYKEYFYKTNGLLDQIKEKSNDGTSTDKNYLFTYNPFGQLTQKSGTTNGKSFTTAYAYRPEGRLGWTTEYLEGRQFYKQNIVYDQFGRIKRYDQGLVSNGITTAVAVENNYSTWDGTLYQLKQENTGKILWELQTTNAKGQVKDAKLGAAQIQNDYDPFGFLNTSTHISTAANLLDTSYIFDAVRNELKQRKHNNFGITELFDYDTNNRLINWTDPITGIKPINDRNTYDIKGRITVNDQLGNIGYTIGGNIYRASKINLNSNGLANYGIGGQNILLQNITYNENNDPIKIKGTQNDYAFEYGLSESRQIMSYGGKFTDSQNAQFTKYYSESGDAEVILNRSTGQEKHLLYIGGSPYESNIVYLKDFAESTPKFVFLHKDYLGSILAISDEAGNALEKRHFDAWGNFTHFQKGTAGMITNVQQIAEEDLLIDRGYTSHEHLAGVALIHMNGRLYDPLLRRFLNADENIQDPTNTQNYNKYGYVMNNPLMYNDPNGEFIFLIFAALPVFWGTVATAAVIGAAIGAGMYAVQAAITGNWSWGGFAKSVFMGAVTGAVSGGLGQVFSASGFWASVGNGALAGAGSGGITSIINGTNFLEGLVKGAVIGGAVAGISYTINFYANGNNKTQYTTTDEVNADGSIGSADSKTMNENLAKATNARERSVPGIATKSINSEAIGLSDSNGFLINSAGKKFLGSTTPNFWSGKSDILYSTKAASDYAVLGRVMSHETAHAYRFAMGLPKLDINGGYGGIDTVEHLTIRQLEYTYAAKNGIMASWKNGYYFKDDITNTFKLLQPAQKYLYNLLKEKFSPIFNINYSFP